MIVLSRVDRKSKSEEFQNATPIRHLVLDGIIDQPELLSATFPDPQWPNWSPLSAEYEAKKYLCRELDVFPIELKNLIGELTSANFLKFLEDITGMYGLIPDPHLEGGGLHLSTEGGILAPHTDFHIYDRLNLYRQINLIVYLNHDWCVGDGGTLRLWDGRSRENPPKEVRIDPVLGRMIIFKTDDRSVHGFTDPVSTGKVRKSIALYYYTAIDNSSFSGDYTTFWRSDRDFVERLSPRQLLYRFLLQTSRGFSFLAHLVNPRLGLRWWRVRRKQIQ